MWPCKIWELQNTPSGQYSLPFSNVKKKKKKGKKGIILNVECSTNSGSQIRPDGGGEGISRIKIKKKEGSHDMQSCMESCLLNVAK